MKPLVVFDSALGRTDANGRPLGKIDYTDKIPKAPQRWRIVFAARQTELKIREERELAPPMKLRLTDLIQGYVLPAIDDVIADCRKTVNQATGWEHSEKFFEISAEFQIYRWR